MTLLQTHPLNGLKRPSRNPLPRNVAGHLNLHPRPPNRRRNRVRGQRLLSLRHIKKLLESRGGNRSWRLCPRRRSRRLVSLRRRRMKTRWWNLWRSLDRGVFYLLLLPGSRLSRFVQDGAIVMLTIASGQEQSGQRVTNSGRKEFCIVQGTSRKTI